MLDEHPRTNRLIGVGRVDTPIWVVNPKPLSANLEVSDIASAKSARPREAKQLRNPTFAMGSDCLCLLCIGLRKTASVLQAHLFLS